jgi:transposase
VTADIHQGLESLHLPPSEHFADTGYVDGDQLGSLQLDYGIDLVGPVTVDPSWQAKAGQGYDATQFTIDWQARQVTCPQGKTSRKWKLAHDRRYRAVMRVECGRAECLACPCRSLCTTAASNPRQLTLRPYAQYQAIQAARERQTTPAFTER